MFLNKNFLFKPVIFPKADKIASPTGRYLWRHNSDTGTVVQMQYGTRTLELYVADAAYRGTGATWSSVAMTSSGIPDLTYTNFYFNGTTSGFSATTPLEGNTMHYTEATYLSYSQVQYWVANDLTGKENTDILCAASTNSNMAANKCRAIVINHPDLGALDCPNAYEMMALWFESDLIDELDPTADDYPNLKLGYTATYGRFSFFGNSGCAWCSSRRSSYGTHVNSEGGVYYGTRTNSYGWMPTKELRFY